MHSRVRMALLAGTGLLLATGLAACSDPEPDAAPIENSAFDEEAPPPSPEPTVEAAEPIVSENLSAVVPPAEDLPPPPPIAPDEQVMDDASATGMTSRSTRGDAAEYAPADEMDANQAEQ